MFLFGVMENKADIMGRFSNPDVIWSTNLNSLGTPRGIPMLLTHVSRSVASDWSPVSRLSLLSWAAIPVTSFSPTMVIRGGTVHGFVVTVFGSVYVDC